MSLMMSISGIRGIVGQTFTPEVVVRYSAAFAEYCRATGHGSPEIVIGRDGRAPGNIFTNIASSTLLSAGINVRALGVCPTPTVQLAVEKTGAAGGISVTASHNPAEWNGLKFLGSSGMFLDAGENRRLLSLADSPGDRYAGWNSTGRHQRDDSWLDAHIHAALSARYVDPEIIRNGRFHVVVDCVNASASEAVPRLLRQLGCEVTELYCDGSGLFPHTPEPLPENLKDICEAVKTRNADLGIAVDPDGDRLVLINERGEPFGEEYTVTAAILFVLDHEKRSADGKSGRAIVVNLSTTRAVEDLAAKYGARVIRTPVGEINVAKAMKETGALIGGEGSGGVIYPAVHLGRDALVGIPLILQLLAEYGGTLSDLRKSLPQYHIVKDKLPSGAQSPEVVLDRIRDSAPADATVNDQDGIRIDFQDSWVHLRKSNTEPVLRVIAEAPTKGEATRLLETYRTIIEQMKS